jgi:hypothetical protein
MQNPDVVAQLRKSIDDERVANLNRLTLYRELTNKMLAYQNGCGEEPSVGEFEQWRTSAEEAIRIRKLQGQS